MFLNTVNDLNAESRSSVKVITELLSFVTSTQDYLRNPVSLEVDKNDFEERPSIDEQHGLGNQGSERTEPRSLPSDQHDSLFYKVISTHFDATEDHRAGPKPTRRGHRVQ